jgi:iron complex transport system substrate-binding protein
MQSSVARRGAVALGATLCLALSACASGPSRPAAAPAATVATTPETTATAAATTGYPLTVQSAQGPVRIASRPKAIVSLSPTATEMLFAIGAGAQVIAVDAQSDYPPGAPRSALSGFKPNVEAISADKPDLVVISDNSSGLAAELAKVDIPVVVDPPATTLSDTYGQLSQLGAATGHPAAAAGVVAAMRSQIDQLIASVPRRSPAPAVYYELDQTLYSATSSTFIGQLVKLLGAADIADAADKTGSGYPQLSDEYVVKADPDVIFLADTRCCQQTPATVAARPGWSGVSAVRTAEVVNLDDDIASRWGPRVVDLVRTMAQAFGRLPAAG